jgi:hypothetical protein
MAESRFPARKGGGIVGVELDYIVIRNQDGADGGHTAIQHGSFELPANICRLHAESKDPSHSPFNGALERPLQAAKHG